MMCAPLLAILLLAHLAGAAGTLAKNYAGQPGYPTPDAWTALNSTLGGRLIHYVPAGHVCYGAAYNRPACLNYLFQWRNASWTGDDPGMTGAPFWAGNPCPPIGLMDPVGPEGGCTLGRYPEYVVRVKGKADVSAALRFAAKWNVRVVVKNTGHDFLGRNLGVGALSIWTRHLKGLQWFDAWKPSVGNYSVGANQTAIRIGAGMTWNEVNDIVVKRGYIVVSGAEGTVGAAGGWMGGGGHGPYSNQYGFGVENVLELDVVLPTGEPVIVNKVSYPDLFRALRGGGSSTYGIVTAVTYKIYPKPPSSLIMINALADPRDRTPFFKAMAYFFAKTPEMNDFGLSGYPWLTWTNYAGTLQAPGKTDAELKAFIDPIIARMQSYGCFVSAVPVNSSVLDLVPGGVANGLSGVAQVFFAYSMGSRLLARSALNEGNMPAIEKMLRTTLTDKTYLMPYPNIPGAAHANRSWDDIGLNPAWKKASTHVLVMANDDTFQNLPRLNRDMVDKYIPALDALSENHGAYINEASKYEKDWKTTFYGGGAHYESLLTVKRKYDPKNVLWCHPCVGGDVFVEGDGGRLYLP
ncbi:FAD-binding domain-containing protein [Trichodelitschia bisporula]|uniref:FAD-binding domain-containing protein n=1 Tax=Trichodelitschia bisporula TaxID=703511 RepID=A0A6G1HTI3_9PEZI|nr:FAD-binding domain-containing protein [Trichodelitschia bisporula]